MGRGMSSMGVPEEYLHEENEFYQYDILRLGISADTEHIQVPSPQGSGTGSALFLEAKSGSGSGSPFRSFRGSK